MVFSSPIFLFVFLPLALCCLLFSRPQFRNLWLLAFSIIFYAWGEAVFVFLMLASTVVNYFLGLWVERKTEPRARKWALVIAVTLNIGTLVFFKYANFLVGNINEVLALLKLPLIQMGQVTLPIGISFFTFHALSYVMDIYRRKWTAARNPGDVALYIFFFPQLIAGPILRWSGIAPQIASRKVSVEKFNEGVKRFVGGLGKKMLIANAVALPADQIFALPSQEMSPALAWCAALCYSMQIYFDFSGYSDMAVGLGKMFGFQFLENFNYPYISRSVKEFWQRWHISLSSWFRDYLYIPLGGNRCSEPRIYLNLMIVFFTCGLWHGASWTFVFWGVYHGLFLILERTPAGNLLSKVPRPFQYGYTILAWMIGWVLFRSDSFAQFLMFVKNMFGMLQAGPSSQLIARYMTRQVLLALVLAVIFSMPTWPWLKRMARGLPRFAPESFRPVLQATGFLVETCVIVLIFFTSLAWMAGSTYNPFIYFRF